MPKELFLHVINPDHNQSELTSEDINEHEYYNLYRISCFFYALAGFIRIHQNQKLDGYNLIIQSIVSYMSDVQTIGISSKWHVVDRYFAFSISIYHFYSLRNSSYAHKIINVLLFLVGFRHLKKSQKLYSLGDKDFMLEHAKWHLVAPMMSLFK